MGLFSSIFGSKGSAVTDPGAMEAWNVAKPTFEYANTAGTNLVQNILANPAYSGDRVAALNQFQTGSADNAGNFSNTTAPNAYTLTNSGVNNLGFGTQYGGNASNIFSQYGTGDQLGASLAAGNQFANNPFVNGLIDSVGRDVTRNLFENQLNGINRSAAGSGNMNSTRAGVESAIATRGAGDRLADMSAQIRSQFFNNGVNQYNQNLQNALQSNQGLLNAGNFGINAMNAGQNYANNNFMLGQAAGGMYQNQDQNLLNANKDYFNESMQNPLAALQALAGIGQATQTKTSAGTTTTPSIASQVGGFLSAFK